MYMCVKNRETNKNNDKNNIITKRRIVNLKEKNELILFSYNGAKRKSDWLDNNRCINLLY